MTDEQRRFLHQLVELERRSVKHRMVKARKRHGDKYDPARLEKRLEWLTGLLKELA